MVSHPIAASQLLLDPKFTMSRNFDLLAREALAAPTTDSDNHVQSVVILIVSILSTLGAGWIIISFVVCTRSHGKISSPSTDADDMLDQAFRNLRTFRHTLILGLAISDCVMAINFLSSSAMNVAGRYIGDPAQKHFCSFNGFMTQGKALMSMCLPVRRSDLKSHQDLSLRYTDRLLGPYHRHLHLLHPRGT